MPLFTWLTAAADIGGWILANPVIYWVALVANIAALPAGIGYLAWDAEW